MFIEYLDFLSSLTEKAGKLLDTSIGDLTFVDYITAIVLQLEWLALVILTAVVIVIVLVGTALFAQWAWIKIIRRVFDKYQHIAYRLYYEDIEECAVEILNDRDAIEDEKIAITAARDEYVKRHGIPVAIKVSEEEKDRLDAVSYNTIPKLWLVSVISYMVVYAILLEPIAVSFLQTKFPYDDISVTVVISYLILAILAALSLYLANFLKDYEIFVKDRKFMVIYDRISKQVRDRKHERKKAERKARKQAKREQKKNK